MLFCIPRNRLVSGVSAAPPLHLWRRNFEGYIITVAVVQVGGKKTHNLFIISVYFPSNSDIGRENAGF